jgi:hypothetical protein
MNNSQSQRTEQVPNTGYKNLLVEWLEGEQFCLNIGNESFFKPVNPIKKERTYYVKLVIDVPGYRVDRSTVRLRWDRRHGRMDCPSVVCSFPSAIFGVSRFWPQKRGVTEPACTPSSCGRANHLHREEKGASPNPGAAGIRRVIQAITKSCSCALICRRVSPQAKFNPCRWRPFSTRLSPPVSTPCVKWA